MLDEALDINSEGCLTTVFNGRLDLVGSALGIAAVEVSRHLRHRPLRLGVLVLLSGRHALSAKFEVALDNELLKRLNRLN